MVMGDGDRVLLLAAGVRVKIGIVFLIFHCRKLSYKFLMSSIKINVKISEIKDQKKIVSR